jgi:arylformamidase
VQAFQSEIYADAGAHFIALDFNTVLETNGDLVVMADQVRRAMAWIYRNARSFGGDANRLYLSGHSSGAHLAAVALTTDWPRAFGIPADAIKGGLLLSGIFDLGPVSLSSRRTYVTFTDTVTEALSPRRHLERLAAPLIIAHGTADTPEFQRQSREFADAVKAAGKLAAFIVLDGCNHFEAWESLGNPYGLLGGAVLRQMKLASRTSAARSPMNDGAMAFDARTTDASNA